MEQGSAPQAVLTGHSIAQRDGASGMTGSGKWTPVKRDLVTVVARHVESHPGVEHVEGKVVAVNE